MSSGFKNPMPAQEITPGGRNEAITTMANNNAAQAKLVNATTKGGSRRRYGGFTAQTIRSGGLPADVTERQQGASNQSQTMLAASSAQASGNKVGGKRNRRRAIRRTKKQKRSRHRHKTPRNRTRRTY